MIALNKLHYLRNTPGEEIVREYASFSGTCFAENGIPVVIAARNEEADLPATLLALADSHDSVLPIVAENGSSDRTQEFARTMGAVVLTGASHKMDALHQSVDYVIQQCIGRAVLFTDADTLVGRNWVGAMSPDNHHAGESHVRFGSVMYAHGEASHVDIIRTMYGFAKDIKSLASGARPTGRGANMSIYFSEEDDTYEEYMQLPPNLFIAEEEKITDLVVGQGGKVSRALGIRPLVVTRGDRYNSISTLLRLTSAGGLHERMKQYKDYGDFTPHQ